MGQQTVPLSANIRNGLKYLSEQDRRTFLRKFQDQNEDRRLLAHTRIELIPCVFGSMMGFTPRYEPDMGGQTPDWLFLDREARAQFFGDVLNFHMNDSIAKEMDEALRSRQLWSSEDGVLPASEDRLYPSLKDKAGKYKGLADRLSLPFVVFVYGWFDAFLHPLEVENCLRNPEYGLFKDYPQLTGVYHFDDAMSVGGEHQEEAGYRFRYFPNRHASWPLGLTDGFVPVPIPEPPTAQQGEDATHSES